MPVLTTLNWIAGETVGTAIGLGIPAVALVSATAPGQKNGRRRRSDEPAKTWSAAPFAP